MAIRQPSRKFSQSKALDLLKQLETDFNQPAMERLAALQEAITRLDRSREPERLRNAISALDKVMALSPGNKELLSLRRDLMNAQLWLLVDGGLATWSGGKPKGASPRVRLDLSRPLSDFVIENRR